MRQQNGNRMRDDPEPDVHCLPDGRYKRRWDVRCLRYGSLPDVHCMRLNGCPGRICYNNHPKDIDWPIEYIPSIIVLNIM